MDESWIARFQLDGATFQSRKARHSPSSYDIDGMNGSEDSPSYNIDSIAGVSKAKDSLPKKKKNHRAGKKQKEKACK